MNWPRVALTALGLAAPISTFLYARSGAVPLALAPIAAFSVVPWRDAIEACRGSDCITLGPGELWQRHLYDRAYGDTAIAYGLGIPQLRDALREHFGSDDAGLRVRTRQAADPRAQAAFPTVTQAVADAARYLARAQHDDGRFRYLVLASTAEEQPGYNMARHTGAMFFMAQSLGQGTEISQLVSAHSYMRSTLKSCGSHRCVVMPGENYAGLGAAAIGVISLAEWVAQGTATAQAREDLERLADFVSVAQKPNGDFKHIYDFNLAGGWADVSFPYYSGEATLALARAGEALHRPEWTAQARRGLAFLSHKGWNFFGSKYYAGEEHWTCQALDALWNTPEAEHALAFCIDWNRAQRATQYAAGETPYDSEGAYGFGPWLVPRTTPAASRSEAAGATLVAWRKRVRAGLSAGDATEQTALRAQLAQAANYLQRMQLPGRFAPLMRDPEAMRGAWAGSESDDRVQIDFVQHAGSALLRWQEVIRTDQSPPK